jgi:hypothetical protein
VSTTGSVKFGFFLKADEFFIAILPSNPFKSAGVHYLFGRPQIMKNEK